MPTSSTSTAVQTVLDRLRRLRVVPVIVIEDAANAAPLARALADGGLPSAEVTFGTAQAAEALRRITGEAPDMLVGAGTVLTAAQAAEARAAGAAFVAAPGFSPPVVDYCLEHDMPVFPGVCTPTEIEAALQKGLRTLQFFPAEPAGGVAFLQAIAAPYADVRFIPTSGISAANIASYLALEQVVACGGSWMAPADWIASGQFERIRQTTQAAMVTVQPLREAGAAR